MTNDQLRSVLIIGGGLAGLTAALRLSDRGFKVTLVEEHKELGGRLLAQDEAGSLKPSDTSLLDDRLPPVLLGCYTTTWALLTRLGTASLARSLRRPTCEFLLPDARLVRLRRPRLLAPLQTIGSLATFRGLPWRDRWRLLSFLEQTWEGHSTLPEDLEQRTSADWLTAIGQSKEAQAQFWSPVVRFLLGGDLHRTSAALLVSLCVRGFLSARRHADITIPPIGLRQLIVSPIHEQLARAGATIRVGCSAIHLRCTTDRVASLQLLDGTTQEADWYILALPHQRLSALLPERMVTHFSSFQQFAQLTDTPAVTVHFEIDYPAPAPRLVLLAHRTFHWFVIRSGGETRNYPAVVSIVATGNVELLSRSNHDLRKTALDDIATIWPGVHTTQIRECRIIRTSRAFLSSSPGARHRRPLQESPLSNLLLAGHWTETGWPGNLESAILSGERCVQIVGSSTTIQERN